MSTASSTSTSAKPSPRSILEAKNCSKSAARDQRGCLILRKNLARSEEHTSELQSRLHLVCRLLLEKKKILHPPGKALDVNHSMFTVVLDQIADDIHSYPFRLFEHRADQCLHDTSSLPHCSPMPVP